MRRPIAFTFPGEVVTREELHKRIWPSNTFVDFEGGVYNAIKRLREALGDTADNPRFIETLPRRGYRFIGSIKGTEEAALPNVKRYAGDHVPRRNLYVGLLTLACALLVTIAVFISKDLRQRRFSKDSFPPIRSLAVLPLQNFSGNPAQEYFADGITEQLISELSQIKALKVISRTSVMGYKKTDKSLPQIARELSVDGVIEGSVLRSGNRVRITAQLIYAPTDTHLWATHL